MLGTCFDGAFGCYSGGALEIHWYDQQVHLVGTWERGFMEKASVQCTLDEFTHRMMIEHPIREFLWVPDCPGQQFEIRLEGGDQFLIRGVRG